MASTEKKLPRQQLDDIDRRILFELQRDGRLTNAELAEKVGASTSPTWRHVRQLEESGVIERYVAVVNPLAVNLPVTVFVNITLEKQNQDTLTVFEDAIKKCPEVMECYLMTGGSDYLLRCVVSDLEGYELFLMRNLVIIPSISNIRSSFALRRIQYKTELPLSHLG